MTRTPVLTSRAAPPAGAYSQAVRAGGLVFVSGQLPLDPGGAVVGEGDIRTQTRVVLGNIAAILAEVGASLDRVVKTTVFLTDLDDFAGMNEVYAATFSPPTPHARPSRSAASRAACSSRSSASRMTNGGSHDGL